MEFSHLDFDNLRKKGAKNKRYLHSDAHVFADELATKLRDPRHFVVYLKMAQKYDHQVLRKILSDVLENKNVTTPGKLFSYLVKKHKEEQTPKNTPTDL